MNLAQLSHVLKLSLDDTQKIACTLIIAITFLHEEIKIDSVWQCSYAKFLISQLSVLVGIVSWKIVSVLK